MKVSEPYLPCSQNSIVSYRLWFMLIFLDNASSNRLFVRVQITRRHLSLIFYSFPSGILFKLCGYDTTFKFILYLVIFYDFNLDVAFVYNRNNLEVVRSLLSTLLLCFCP